MHLLSICPNMLSDSGHDVAYTQAMGQALQAVGWGQTVLLPSCSTATADHENWLRTLPGRQRNTTKSKLLYFARLAVALKKVLRRSENIEPTRPLTVFMEHFTLLELYALLWGFWHNDARSKQLALLFRRDYDLKGARGLLYRIAISLAALGGNRVRLFTDSELLSGLLSEFSGAAVTTLPIPHALSSMSEPDARASADSAPSSVTTMWWPGSPRPEKGLAVLEMLTERWDASLPLRLLVSERAQLHRSTAGRAVVTLPEPLAPAEYQRYMNAADVILLPYDAQAYRCATSGIFVEAVAHGKVPAVSEGTWMAFELRRHNLQELIVAWERPGVLAHLTELSRNEATAAKLRAMASHYLLYHTKAAFGQLLTDRLVN